MNASPTTDTIQTTAALTLWRVAEAFMHILHALFGDPSHVAAKHTLTLKAHRLMASWLRAGEAMMRRLLLIEAAAFAKPNIRPLLRDRRKSTRKLMHFYPETPEHWRVSFRCFVPRGLSPSKASETPSALPPDQVPGQGSRPFVFRENRTPRGLSLSKTGKSHNALRQAQGSKRGKRLLRQEREWVLYQEPLAFRSAWPLAERYEALLRVFNAPLAYARRLARQLHAKPHRTRELLHAPPEAAQRIDQFDAFTSVAETSAALFNTS
jgi:hypothetical protein